MLRVQLTGRSSNQVTRYRSAGVHHRGSLLDPALTGGVFARDSLKADPVRVLACAAQPRARPRVLPHSADAPVGVMSIGLADAYVSEFFATLGVPLPRKHSASSF